MKETAATARRPAIVGIVGLAVGFLAVAIPGLVSLAGASVLDLSLLGVLFPWAMGYFLLVGGGAGLANGVVWFALMRKAAWQALPWMALSLAGAFAAPWILLYGVAMLRSDNGIAAPQTSTILICCLLPVALLAIWTLAFWALQSQARPDSNAVLSEDGPAHRAQDPSVSAPSTHGSAQGTLGFWLGTVIALLVALILSVVFGVAVRAIFQAELNAPSTSGGFGLDLSALDAGLYIIVLWVLAGLITGVVSAGLLSLLVAPRLTSAASKAIVVLLFMLLSVVLNLGSNMLVLTYLLLKLDPL